HREPGATLRVERPEGRRADLGGDLRAGEGPGDLRAPHRADAQGHLPAHHRLRGARDGRAVTAPRRIRVLVVDDSSFMRAALSRLLGSDPRLEVVGTAKDGADAVERARGLT